MWQEIPPSRNAYRWRLSTSGVGVLDRVVEVGVLERRARAADRTSTTSTHSVAAVRPLMGAVPRSPGRSRECGRCGVARRPH